MRGMSSRRGGERGMTAVEAAVAFAIVGVTLAAVVPSCLRSVRLARTAEAAENLERVMVSAAAQRNAAPQTALASTPLTPATVPRGQTVSDAPGTWDHPTWKAIGFSIDEPHWYAYRLDVDPDAATPLRAVAYGDLDGDGLLSTFERSAKREGGQIVPRPEMIVTADLE
jgi:type II secretory pathway pseudopilin PulG